MTVELRRNPPAELAQHLQIRSHELITDATLAEGGDDAGPSPHEARVCISEGEILGNSRRVRKFTREQYFKSSAQMAELFADVPTTGEFGLPDVRMDTWFGLIAPPNTPEPVVSQVARAIETGLQQQSFREKLFRIGCEAVWKSPADFAAFIAADGDKWSKLIPAMGISLAD